MGLIPGERLGPYEILAPLGAGGMGEVYRARDIRLAREVAIKILPASFTADPDRQRRFQQEARAAGALNHPNILAIHDVGEQGGVPYVVSELLEGETLFEHLRGGALPARKAIEIATQIAHGLAAAHEKGIVHRDLKPANVFITKDGRARILDFGLARVTRVAVSGEALSAARTLPPETEPGAVVGTVGYMSPEQVRGQDVDHRSDIFSLGAILYEMLSGRRAFRKDSNVETLGAILREEPPDLEEPGRAVPPGLVRIVRHCLEKAPEQRFQSAGDLAFHLETLSTISGSGPREAGGAGTSAPVARRRTTLVLALGLAVLFASGAVLGLWLGRSAEAPAPPILKYLTYSGKDRSPAASPDGRTIAFTSYRDGVPRIWLKQIAGGGEAALTDGSDDQARFSPDGAMILFLRVEGERTSLFRMAVVGGEPRRLLEDVTGADWSPDSRRIVFTRWVRRGQTTDSIVGLIDTGGANLTEVAHLENQQVGLPRWSPVADTVSLAGLTQAGGPQSIILVDMESGTTRRLYAPSPGLGFISAAAWSGSGGEIVYSRGASVASVLVGSDAYVVRQDISSGASQTLFWSPGNSLILDILGPGQVIFDARSARENLHEIRLGTDRPAGMVPGFSAGRWLTRGSSGDRQPVYAPGGDRVVFSSNRTGALDLWEISTKTGALRRITDDKADDWDPAFTADGRLVWSSNRSGAFEIWTANADGSGARQITQDGVDAENPAVAPDGRWILYGSGNPEKLGIWKIRADGSQATRLLTGSAILPEISPDGRYFSYVSAFGTGAISIKVARVDDGQPVAFQIEASDIHMGSAGTIGRSRWMPDGRAIAFLGQDERGSNGIYAQDFLPGKDTTSTRRRLMGFDSETGAESFGISSDGMRMTVAGWEQATSIMLAQGVAGISRPAAKLR